MKLRTSRSRSLATAIAAAVVPLVASSQCASAQTTPIYGGPTYDEVTGAGYNNAAFTSATGVPVNSSGVAVGIADRYAAGALQGKRAVLLSGAGSAFELTGLTTDPSAIFESSAYSINAAGQVAGFSNKKVNGVDLGDRAVRWDPAGNPLELGNLGTDATGATDSYAYSLNASGQTVGLASKYTGGVYKGERAVRWNATTGAALELGNIGLDSQSSSFGAAYSINAASQSAGYMSKYNGNQYKGDRAVRWDAAGAALELGPLGLSNQSVTSAYAYGINASGQVVGQSAKYVSGSLKGDRAVRWDAATGAALELAILGTDSSNTTYAYGFAINDAGQTAGRSFKYVGGVSKGERAIRWNSAGSAFELGNLGLSATGSTSASAFGINAYGEAVGRSKKYVGGVDQGDRAVYWTIDGSAVDLNTLIDPASNWTLTRARAITDNGWVTGFGLFDPDGAGGPISAYQRQFLLRVASENPWLNAAGGAWQTGGNWSTNVAPGATVDALFNLGSTYTINLTAAGSARVAAVQSGNVTLDLGGNTLAVGAVVVGRDAGDNAHLTTNGSGTLMIGGAFTVAANAGATGAYTLAGGTLNAPMIAVNSGGTFTYAAGTINTSIVQLTGNAQMALAPGHNKTLKLSTITTGATSKLDLSDNKLVVTSGGSGGVGTFNGTTYSGLTGRIASAYQFGSWNGPGIMTSMPDAGPLVGLTTLAISTADATFYAGSTFGGVSVGSGDVLIMYTYAGDLNLDGLVDAADYGIIDNYFQFPGTSGYANGDFNYDGIIDAGDYGIIDNTYQLQGPPIPTDVATPSDVSAVPEPTAAIVMLFAPLAALSRRRRWR